MFLKMLGNIFASWEANYVSATMFPKVGKQGNIDRKQYICNVSILTFSDASSNPARNKAFSVVPCSVRLV